MAAGERAGAIAQESRRRRPDQLAGGPHRLSRAEVAANQSARIVAAMSDLIATQGYDHTTVEQVIARAGVSRRTFYELRGGREQWFLAICDAIADDLLDRIGLACRQGADRRDRAERVATALVDLCLEDPAGARACFVETLAAGETARAWREALLQRLTETIGRATGGAEGDRQRDELAARAAVGAILELAGGNPEQTDGRYATALVATMLTTGGGTR
jgi:AcrR family transcriptional regulator